jgi:hypothetical protein
LELVHKGLGEMQSLATGVGDLKKVLTNVKTRGTWGEVQLGTLLEQVLNPDQFAMNVATKDGGERVEFAIKLPGQCADKDETIWLPIDAKFPVEDYQRLIEAQERADVDGVEHPGGHFKFLHLWPGQTPPGRTTGKAGLLLGMGTLCKAAGGFFEAIALAAKLDKDTAMQ